MKFPSTVKSFLHFSKKILDCIQELNYRKLRRKEVAVQTLESLRESKGVTKVAIANYLGVSRPTYDWYEDNPHKMRVETALAVAEFLGVDVNEIFFAARRN